LAAALPLHAQEPAGGTLIRAELQVDLSRPGATAHVRIDYRLRVPPGTTRIPITALVSRPGTIADVSAHTPTRALTVELPESSTAQRSGFVHLPGDRPDGVLTLVVEYEVARSITPARADVLYRVPLVAVDWPPADPLPGTFTGRAMVQPDIHVFESFPTTLAGPLGWTGRSVWAVELSVLPAYLTFRGRLYGPPTFTVPRVVDTSILVLLLLLGLLGWSRLRENL
jgi:hypothetical protein